MSERSEKFEELHNVVTEARKELLEVYKLLQSKSVSASSEWSSQADTLDSKGLVDLFNQYFHFTRGFPHVAGRGLFQIENVFLGLSMSLLLCSGRESCFHLVNCGGMEQIVTYFSRDVQNSATTMLLLLGVVEQATSYSVGCEGFLGWWPREEANIPSGTIEGYSELLKLILAKPCRDVSSLATYLLQCLRSYEVALRYEFCLLQSVSTVERVTNATLNTLTTAGIQPKRLLKSIELRGPIEDPSFMACGARSLFTGATDGLLSYKATSGLISSSSCCFSGWDIDSRLLGLLKVYFLVRKNVLTSEYYEIVPDLWI